MKILLSIYVVRVDDPGHLRGVDRSTCPVSYAAWLFCILRRIMPVVFPENFLWGVSTSGFQFEMGDHEGRNIDPNTDWYAWVHDAQNIRENVVSGHTPEKGIDYWSLYKKDHAIAKSIGLNAYRIGLEWSRIFPEDTGRIEVGIERASDGNIARIDTDDRTLEELEKAANKEAVDHYGDVVEDLRERGLEVFVCLNHFTLPLWIHNPIAVRDTKLRKGPRGWVDEKTIIEFTKYAAYVAWKLGDIVDKWAIFNEPMVVSEAGYVIQSGFPPGLENNFKAYKKAASNMIVAHARAYDAIKTLDKVRSDEDSSDPAYVGLIQNVIPTEALDKGNNSHVKAASLMDRMHNHFFPQSVSYGWLDQNLNGAKDKGETKGYLERRLDWLGVNYYTRAVVEGKRSIIARLFAGIPVIPKMVQNYGLICEPNSTSADGMPTSDFGWELYPQGMFQALKAMEKYETPIYITENGVADARDLLGPQFITNHLEVLERVVDEEKIDVRGYFHWSLTDNYEWAEGFRMKFGLYSVDLENKSRIERKSARTYTETIKTHT